MEVMHSDTLRKARLSQPQNPKAIFCRSRDKNRPDRSLPIHAAGIDMDRFSAKTGANRNPMSLEFELQKFPKKIVLKDKFQCSLRPLKKDDEKKFHEFFLAVPEEERMFIKHRVTEPAVIRDWCQNIDLGRNFPLLAIADGKIVGDATLHQQLGGWKRHIGRVSVLVLPKYRGKGLARAMVTEIVQLARNLGLERVEAEFIGEQEAAIKMFAILGFSNLVRLENYVKDMQAISHDYVLMGVDLKVDEDYAGGE